MGLVAVRLYLPGGLLKRADADLSDLTTSQRTGDPYWAADEVDVLVVPLSGSPTAAQQKKIRRRLVTIDAADEARLYRLLAMTASSPIEQEWLDTELARYGEPST